MELDFSHKLPYFLRVRLLLPWHQMEMSPVTPPFFRLSEKKIVKKE